MGNPENERKSDWLGFIYMTMNDEDIRSRAVDCSGKRWTLLAGLRRPYPKRGRGREMLHDTTYPFMEMRIGEAFLWPEPYSAIEMSKCLTRANHSQAVEGFGRMFSCRKVGREMYCWRVK